MVWMLCIILIIVQRKQYYIGMIGNINQIFYKQI